MADPITFNSRLGRRVKSLRKHVRVTINRQRKMFAINAAKNAKRTFEVPKT